MVEELDAKSLSVSLGILKALIVLSLGLYAAFTGQAAEIVELISGFYPGYSATPLGAFIGGFYGLIDGLIIGYLIASIYNYALRNR